MKAADIHLGELYGIAEYNFGGSRVPHPGGYAYVEAVLEAEELTEEERKQFRSICGGWRASTSLGKPVRVSYPEGEANRSNNAWVRNIGHTRIVPSKFVLWTWEEGLARKERNRIAKEEAEARRAEESRKMREANERMQAQVEELRKLGVACSFNPGMPRPYRTPSVSIGNQNDLEELVSLARSGAVRRSRGGAK